MSIPIYPKPLVNLITNKLKTPHENNEANVPYDVSLPVEHNEGVVREMLIEDSVEMNNDSTDMPLEVEKNLNANLGPTDTEAESKSREQTVEKAEEINSQETSPIIKS